MSNSNPFSINEILNDPAGVENYISKQESIQALPGRNFAQSVDTSVSQASAATLGRGGGSGTFKLDIDEAQGFVQQVRNLSSQNFDGSDTPIATGRFDRYAQISGGRLGTSAGATQFAQAFEEHRNAVGQAHTTNRGGVSDLGDAVDSALQTYQDTDDKVKNSIMACRPLTTAQERAQDAAAARRINQQNWTTQPNGATSASGRPATGATSTGPGTPPAPPASGAVSASAQTPPAPPAPPAAPSSGSSDSSSSSSDSLY